MYISIMCTFGSASSIAVPKKNLIECIIGMLRVSLPHFAGLYVLHVSNSLTGAATRFKLLILLEPMSQRYCFYSEYTLVRHRHHQVTLVSAIFGNN